MGWLLPARGGIPTMKSLLPMPMPLLLLAALAPRAAAQCELQELHAAASAAGERFGAAVPLTH